MEEPKSKTEVDFLKIINFDCIKQMGEQINTAKSQKL